MSGSLRVLVVDDEALARDALRIRLERQPDVELLPDCRSGREATRRIPAEEPDLVFLDVRMPDLDGFEVLEELGPPSDSPLVIFATAYDEFALAAFDRHAVDYLLKPFDDDRFDRALARARRAIRERRAGEWMERLEAAMTEWRATRTGGRANALQRILVRSRGRRVLLPVSDIVHARADGNYVRLYVDGGKHYLIRSTLSALERQLDPGQFARIHRSAIANLDRVAEIVPYPNGTYEIVLHDGSRLTLSRSYRDALLERWKC